MGNSVEVGSYIPVSRARVRKSLLSTLQLDESQKMGIEQIADILEAMFRHGAQRSKENLKAMYETMDPDSLESASYAELPGFLVELESLLTEGKWQTITEKEVERALSEEDVFPISLKVPFGDFHQYRLYKLGETLLTDTQKSWFGLRKTKIRVQTFDRVLQVLHFKERDWFVENKRLRHYPGDHNIGLHLQVFKSVPKLDLEIVFPGTKPKMRWRDGANILAPAVAGAVIAWIKFGPMLFGEVASDTSTAVVLGTLFGLCTYMVRSYLSYRSTRERYLAHVSKELYFKAQASNGAVLHLLADLLEEHHVRIALIAYAILLAESDKDYDEEGLKERVKSWLATNFDVDVDYDVLEAIEHLENFRLLTRRPDGCLGAVPIAEGLAALRHQWEGLYDYHV